jgi:hypothetical protein
MGRPLGSKNAPKPEIAPIVSTERTDRIMEEAPPPRPKYEIPEGWTRGELLNYISNSQTCLFYRNAAANSSDSIQFGSVLEANDFSGWWYAPMAVRMTEQA